MSDPTSKACFDVATTSPIYLAVENMPDAACWPNVGLNPSFSNVTGASLKTDASR